MIGGSNLIRSYKSVINKEYITIYLIYFLFFLSNGPVEKVIPVIFDNSGLDGSVYGFFLSVNNMVHVFLPFLISFLTVRYSSYLIAVIAMILSFCGSFFVGISDLNAGYAILFCVMIISGRTVFNFSFGNMINYKIDKRSRGKYFALRDLFLFGSISVGLFAGGIITEKINIKAVYTIFGFGFLLTIPLIAVSEKQFREKSKASEKFEGDDLTENVGVRKAYLINKDILKDKNVIAFIVINFCTIIYSTSMNFLPLLGVSMGISVSDIMSVFSLVAIVNSAVALYLGQKSDFCGRKWIYVFDLAFDTLPALVFAFTNSIVVFVIGVLLTMIKDALAPMSFAYYYDCFSEKDGILIYGFLESFGTGLSFFVPAMVGKLWMISPIYVFLAAFIGNIIAAVTAGIILPDIKMRE